MKKLIKLYGERNTGTNYVSKLIALNLDVDELRGVVPPLIRTLQRRLPGQELVRDIYFFLTYRHNLGWKHSRVKPPSKLKRYDTLKSEICFVTLTKNPYSWLVSLYRRPHHQYQYYDNKPGFETFLRSPWKTVGRDNCQKDLPSPVMLWNVKNSSYLQLRRLGGMNLTIESVLRDPENIVEKLSSHFGIDRVSGEFVNYERSTKGENKSFADYQSYYLNERWREVLSEESILIINEAVDKDLMDYFGYEVLFQN